MKKIKPLKDFLTYVVIVLAASIASPAASQVTTYCCDATAEANFNADLAAMAFPTTTAAEGFEQGDWVATQTFPQPGNVSNLGIVWSPLVSGGFGTSTGGGSVHEGTYLMFAVDDNLFGHPVPDGYNLSSSGFILYAMGGWFTGSGAKLEFTLDSDPLRVVDFTGSEATVTAWKFLGFIESDPLGFNQVKIEAIDEVGGETEIFFSDDFTLAAEEGGFLDGLIFADGFDDGTTGAWLN